MNVIEKTGIIKRFRSMPACYADILEDCRRRPPRVALVLGSGLADLAEHFSCEFRVPFRDLPNLVDTSVAGHRGDLLLGDWGGQRVLLYSGRLHYYEGHSWRRVEQPVAVARELGAEILLLTNAAGGIRDDLVPGSLMALTDHIDWTRTYPWRHAGPGGLGGPRPSPYSPRLRELLRKTAAARGVRLAEGLYAQVTGPCYETPAEIRALRSCGADAVGMSTGREIAHGAFLGMECAAMSCICNRAAGLSDGPIHHDEVLAIGKRLREILAGIIEGFLEGLDRVKR